MELTQEQLGRRMGLVGGGQAIYRWEGNHSLPRPRQRTALVAAIRALNPAIAAELAALFAADTRTAPAANKGATAAGDAPQAAPTHGTLSAPALRQVDQALTLELALLRMADELDVPPRRAREASLRFLDTLRTARLSTDAAHAAIAEWTARTAKE